MKRRYMAPLLALASLSPIACGESEDGNDLTSSEQRQLDAAAARLDEARAEQDATMQNAPAENDRDDR